MPPLARRAQGSRGGTRRAAGFPARGTETFQLLAMIASVEAPFPSLLNLMHQQREQHIAELREEMSLQVALHAESESTKLLRMMREVHDGAETEDA